MIKERSKQTEKSKKVRCIKMKQRNIFVKVVSMNVLITDEDGNKILPKNASCVDVMMNNCSLLLSQNVPIQTVSKYN